MAKTAVTSDKLPAPRGPYNHVVEVNGTVFTAGFGPQDPATGEVPDSVAEQTEQVISNVETALAEVGLGLADVAKATVHLQHLHRDFAEFNDVYRRRFPEPYPVRTTVGSELANILVEIDVVALRS